MNPKARLKNRKSTKATYKPLPLNFLLGRSEGSADDQEQPDEKDEQAPVSHASPNDVLSHNTAIAGKIAREITQLIDIPVWGRLTTRFQSALLAEF